MYSSQRPSLDCSWSQNYGKLFKIIRIFEYFRYSNNYSNIFQFYEYIRYSYSCPSIFTNILGIRIRPKINIRCNTDPSFINHLKAEYFYTNLVTVLKYPESLFLTHCCIVAYLLELVPAEEPVPVRVPYGEGHQHPVLPVPLTLLQPGVSTATQPAQTLIL